MTKDHWLQSALTNDTLVAELLLRLKHSSDSHSHSHSKSNSNSNSNSSRVPLRPEKTIAITTVLPPRWGHRKNRSKSTAPATTVAYGKEHRGSPTTHLSWSGGGGASTSDGYEECSRPSDLSSGSRSVKANEVASISSYNKSLKRKELASMRVNLNQQMATSESFTTAGIKMRRVGESERQMESYSVKAETKCQQRGFVLPDLNMTPDDEDLSTMMI